MFDALHVKVIKRDKYVLILTNVDSKSIKDVEPLSYTT